MQSTRQALSVREEDPGKRSRGRAVAGVSFYPLKLPPSSLHSYVLSRASKQGRVLTSKGLFLSGTSVSIAEEALGAYQKSQSVFPFWCMFLQFCCWDCNGIFAAEEGTVPFSQHDPPSVQEKGFVNDVV